MNACIVEEQSRRFGIKITNPHDLTIYKQMTNSYDKYLVFNQLWSQYLTDLIPNK